MNRTLTYAGWVLLLAVFAFPFYWMLNLSLQGREALSAYPPRFLPRHTQTTVLPALTCSVVVVKEGGKSREAARLGDHHGSVVIRMLQDGELTSDYRRLPRASATPTGKTVRLPEQTAPLAITRAKRRIAVLGRRETSQGQEIYWTDPDSWTRDKPYFGVSPVEELSILRRVRPRWRNYIELFRRLPFLTFFRNSFFICFMATFGQLLSASMAAYAFARLRFRGRDFWFMVLLATMMIPAQVTMIPMFIGYKSIGWVDSFLPLIVPQFCAGAFNVFLLRQFFLTIPRELDEAAMIDGAGHLTIYWRIVLPLAKPALVVVGVFTFVWFWKDLMGPLIYLDSVDKRTVSLGLEYLRNPHEGLEHLIMPAAVAALLPVAVLFLVCQKYILRGIAITGLKG